MKSQSQGEARSPILVYWWCLLTVPSHGNQDRADAPAQHLTASLRLYFPVASHQKVKFQRMCDVRVVSIVHAVGFLGYLRMLTKTMSGKALGAF